MISPGSRRSTRQCEAMLYLIMVDCVGVCGAYVCIIHMESYSSEIYDAVECEYHTYPYLGWLRVVGSFKLQVSFAKEPYKGDYIQQKRPIILRSLLIEATPYLSTWSFM